MERIVTARQFEVLGWIARGCPDGEWSDGDYTYKKSAIALQNRKLVSVHGHGRSWTAQITDAGQYYLEHRAYPPDHRFHSLDLSSVQRASPSEEQDQAAPAAASGRKRGATGKPASNNETFEIDSPRRLSERNTGRSADVADVPTHPWDAKVLISVKEAAWLLSVSEHLIRQAVLDGDVQRVYIGEAGSRYRIVHASLLAWVNSLPRTSPRYG